jgi:hypothetical protein
MAKGKKTGGRKPGTPNKVSRVVKDDVIAVFERLGGVEHMEAWAKANPGDFYKTLFKALVPRPMEVSSPDGKALVTFVIEK